MPLDNSAEYANHIPEAIRRQAMKADEIAREIGMAGLEPVEEPPPIEEPAPELVPIVVSTTDNGGARVPGEQTVEVRPGVRASGDTTQVLRVPGEDTRVIPRRGMDDTQVIRRPDDGERTQVLRPAGRGGGRTGNGRADRGGSIAGAESPNFADDPTGRLQIPVAQPEEPARTMTVMNLERPPEDGPEIPSPRRPSES